MVRVDVLNEFTGSKIGQMLLLYAEEIAARLGRTTLQSYTEHAGRESLVSAARHKQSGELAAYSVLQHASQNPGAQCRRIRCLPGHTAATVSARRVAGL